jgi:prevent-host-death family protein
MAERYSIAEARAKLPDIVDEAASGTPVELTRRGRPVAVVVSLGEFERLKRGRPRFADLYGRFLAEHPLSAIGLGKAFPPRRRRSTGRRVRL